ncbi:uncharacterized protein LOC117647599 [Thrips palmi]|uniref:Uncharacterized protein LOC117647599 n=1 Tax=Thrips palmi TaxID=161013 RepID=A0A6P8YYT6_THRPL|nr:uncharacterized protein LOC117647599 [Thrips palmi]
MLLAAACLLLPAVGGQFINSYAGPFDVELQRVEICPGAMSGLNLLNFTQRLTRDRKYPKRFYYTGVVQHFFDVLPSLAWTIRLSSWSSRGGWKENAYHHTFTRVCDLAKARFNNPVYRRVILAAMGSDFVFSCPFPASRWEFTDFPVDVTADEFKEFVYGKWRIDIQSLDGKTNTVLSCHREFVDTVPKVQGRRGAGVPAEANYSGTSVKIGPIICTRTLSPINDAEKREAFMFLEQTRLRTGSACCSVLGLFTLDRATMFQVLSNVFSYFVVVLQMSNWFDLEVAQAAEDGPL